MAIKLTSHHKPQPKGVSQKLAREARRVNNCPFREPHNGVMPDATWTDFAAVALFGDEAPPAGFVEIDCPSFAARVYVRGRGGRRLSEFRTKV